jgi:hypothetical protein
VHTAEYPLYTLKPGKRVSCTQKHETCTQRSIRSIQLYKPLRVYARACRLQESILYNLLLAIEHYGLSDNSESSVDVTTGGMKVSSSSTLLMYVGNVLGATFGIRKTEQRHIAVRSCEAFTSSHYHRRIILSGTDIRHLESRGTCAEKDIRYSCTQLFRVYLVSQ